MHPGLGLYCTDAAKHFTTEGEQLDDLSDLDIDLSDLSVRDVKSG